MLKMQIAGYIGQDAQQRTTPQGKDYATFSVCHTETWKDQSGNKQERAIWINVTWWNPNGLIAWLKKGALVHVAGMPSVRTYTDKNNQLQAVQDLRADEVTLLAGAKDAQPAQQEQPQQPSQQPTDGVPF